MNPYHKIKDFHAERLKGVWASDVVTLWGYNKRYKSLYRWVKTGIEERMPQSVRTLWLEKSGFVVQIDDPDPLKGEKKKWGNLQEGLILKEWVLRKTDQKESDTFYQHYIRGQSWGPYRVKTGALHPERRYCGSHADLLWDPAFAPGSFEVMPDPVIVEAKATGAYAAKRHEGVEFTGWDDEDRSMMGTPDRVFVQTQWQAWTYGVEVVYACPLIEGNQWRTYGPIIYDPRHVEQSLALAEKFWNLVTTGTEPTPTTWGDVVSLYPEIEDLTAMVSGEAETSARAMIAEGRELKERVKVLEDKLDDIKMGLGILAGDVKEVVEDKDGVKTTVIKKTMNRVLNDSEGKTLAKFRDQTKDSLSLAEWLASAERKQKAIAAAVKKYEASKMTPAELEAIKEANELTDAEIEATRLEPKLRALGAYKTSETYRVVTY